MNGLETFSVSEDKKVRVGEKLSEWKSLKSVVLPDIILSSIIFLFNVIGLTRLLTLLTLLFADYVNTRRSEADHYDL